MSKILKSFLEVGARKFSSAPWKINEKIILSLTSSPPPQPSNFLQPSIHHTARLPQIRLYAKRAGFKKDKKDKKGQTAAESTTSNEEVHELLDVDEMKQQMQSVLHRLDNQLQQQLALRLSLSSLASIPVLTDHGTVPLSQVAEIEQKTAQLIVVRMTEQPQLTSAVRTAIANSAVNVNPQVEGTTLYLPVQKVTREHREKLAKSAKVIADKAKERMRDVQQGVERDLRKQQDGFSEDVMREAREVVLQVGREFTEMVDKVLKQKQSELLGG